jgi:flagellar hook-basal body complex protein FliE
MSTVQMTQMLAEMQRLAATAGAQGSAATRPADATGFAELLKASMDGVNQSQATATDMAAALERGDANVSLPEVMIALQKARLSFQAMTEVRNRLVTAYQEIMNMPM